MRVHPSLPDEGDTFRPSSTVTVETERNGEIRVYLTLFKQDLLELAESIRDELQEAHVVIPRSLFDRS